MIRCELKAILKAKGIKNGWLADQVGVTDTTLSQWVNNKQIPKLDFAYRVAKVLGMDVTEIWVWAEKEEN